MDDLIIIFSTLKKHAWLLARKSHTPTPAQKGSNPPSATQTQISGSFPSAAQAQIDGNPPYIVHTHF